MAWSFVAAGAASHANAADWTPVEPAGATSGDLLVCIAGFRGTVQPTPPTGWSVAGAQNAGDAVVGGKSGAIVAWIVRGASAPSLTFTGAANVIRGAVFAFRSDAGGTIGLGQSSGATQGTTGTTLTVPGFSTANANELLILGAATGTASGSTFSGYAATDPVEASWTEILDTSTTSGADVRSAGAWATKATAGATGDITAACAVSAYLAGVAVSFAENTGGGGSVASGAGASSGAATATGQGSSTAAASGTAAGAATAAAIGAATASASGSASGSATAAGVGDAGASGSAAGSSTGQATVAGVGASTVAAAGTAAGQATVSGVGSDGSVAEEPQPTGGGGFIVRHGAYSRREIADAVKSLAAKRRALRSVPARKAIKRAETAVKSLLETIEDEGAAPAVFDDLSGLQSVMESIARAQQTATLVRLAHEARARAAAIRREIEDEDEAVSFLLMVA